MIFAPRLKSQLNTLLFSKTLVRKDAASFVSKGKEDESEEKSSSSKSQIMTLMTTDVRDFVP
jgi:hypothetical protein